MDKLLKLEEERQNAKESAEYNRQRKMQMKRRHREEIAKEKTLIRARLEVQDEFRKKHKCVSFASALL